jgi:hypothetical protein
VKNTNDASDPIGLGAVGAALAPHQDAYVIHLDQWVWVKLAVARREQSGIYWELFEQLAECRRRGIVELPLSAQNYLELWNRRSSESRRHVGAVMRDLSGYTTLRAVHEVQREETRRAHLRLRAGLQTNELERSYILGHGVNHAFGSAIGRYRFVESLAAEGVEEGVEVQAPDDFVQLAGRLTPEQWEWSNLVGVDIDYSIPGIDYRPEHRLGDEYAAGRNAVNGEVDVRGAEQSLRYRFLVNLALHGLWDYIVENFDGVEDITDHFRGPTEGIRFVNAIPTANVKVELEYRALTNPKYIFKQHDRGDVLDLALSIPYCDAVWPDAHWTHIAKAAKLADEHGTHFVQGPTDLIRVLDRLK